MAMRKISSVWVLLVVSALAGCRGVDSMDAGARQQATDDARPARAPHVVLVIGESEYKSEQTLPPFAEELKSRYGLRCTVLLAESKSDIPGLEALEDADLAVFYLRFRTLSDEQLDRIKAYLNAGRPLVALRTTTHAFGGGVKTPIWEEFPTQVLGTPWWQFHYGHESSTDVTVVPAAVDHPILTGVAKSFHSRSWLYYVLPLAPSAKPLLMGKSVGPSRREERVVNPVAWTHAHKGGRVFYTSLGHPDDFELEPFRRLLINAVFWALGRPVPAS